jgi:hypothetical protein
VLPTSLNCLSVSARLLSQPAQTDSNRQHQAYGVVLANKDITMTTEYPMHEANNMLPDMSTVEFRSLTENIRSNGLREAIWLDDKGEKIIDGRHRYLACKELGIDPRYRTWDGVGDVCTFVLSLNVGHKSFTTSQAAIIARNAIPALLKYSESSFSPGEMEYKGKPTGRAIAYLAAHAGVSSSSVVHAIAVGKNGVPELDAAVLAGNVSLSAAAVVAVSCTHEEQRKILAGGKKSVAKAAKFIRNANAAKARGEESPLSRFLPNGSYRYKADYDHDVARGM